jgi:hypothetical protein
MVGAPERRKGCCVTQKLLSLTDLATSLRDEARRVREHTNLITVPEMLELIAVDLDRHEPVMREQLWRAAPNRTCTGQTWRDYAQKLEQAWGARGVALTRVAEVLAAARVVVDLRSGDGIKGLAMALGAYDALERESPVLR